VNHWKFEVTNLSLLSLSLFLGRRSGRAGLVLGYWWCGGPLLVEGSAAAVGAAIRDGACLTLSLFVDAVDNLST